MKIPVNFPNWPRCLTLTLAVLFAAQAEGGETTTQSLLAEAMSIAKRRSDLGDTRITAALRLGATMRLAGHKESARAALDECRMLIAKVGDVDTRDETKVELARQYLLLGMPAQARELVGEVTAREYDITGHCLLARTALEMGDLSEAERAVRTGVALAQKPGRKLGPLMGNAMLCDLSRVARELKRPELAGQCEAAISVGTWKSAVIGDHAEDLERLGQTQEALRIASQAPEEHMAVVALARIVAARYERVRGREGPEDAARLLSELLKAATRIKETDKRDFALRIAAGKIAGAGDVRTATKVASEIKSPASRLLALISVVDDPAEMQRLMVLLSACTPSDQPALAAILASHYGAKGFSTLALDTVKHVPAGWPRVRTLCDATRLATSRHRQGAIKILVAAAQELDAIRDEGWRSHARIQIAMHAHRLGIRHGVDEQLDVACRDALKLTPAEDRRAVLPQVIEAALWCGRADLATKTLHDALQRNPEPELRNALVPMLVDANQPEAALAECTKAPLSDDFAQRFVIYRLTKAGRVADARTLAGQLRPTSRAEALADIALAKCDRPASPSRPVRRGPRVGMTLHGGWFYWLYRLERMGVAWEVMPFSLAYEESAKELAGRYAMLGYPGTGGHQIQTSAPGMEHLRDFLRDGGGLFGICAGQLFATGHPSGHRFVPADYYYLRGGGPHVVQMERGHPASPDLPAKIIINRANGDFLLPRPGCDVIGWYDDQKICAAVITAHYGLGRVVVSSPHPEGDQSYSPTDRLCIELTRWLLEGTR